MPFHHLRPCWILKDYARNRLEPVTGFEPVPEEWGTSVLPLHHTGVLPWKALSMAGLLYHFPNGVAPFEVVRSLGVWGLSHGCDGSGIPPAAAPSFRGAKKERVSMEVNWIEPSGQGISPEPCTTHGFGVGGTGGIRTHARLSSPVSFQDCSLIRLGTVPY